MRPLWGKEGDCNGIVCYSSFYRKKKQTDRRELRDTKNKHLSLKYCRFECFTSGIVLRISWYSCKTFGCDLYGVRRGTAMVQRVILLFTTKRSKPTGGSSGTLKIYTC